MKDPHREIERRFLVSSMPTGIFPRAVHRIAQGYLCAYPTTVRLRSRGDSEFFLTVKRGESSDRHEREIPLTKAQFDVLWPMTEGHRLTKLRSEFDHSPHVIELDEFDGPHAGLLIAEVEFDSPAAAAAFAAPDWFGQEITGVPGYSNAELARGITPSSDANQIAS